MKKLLVSLIFVVIAAVSGLGWLVTQVYGKTDEGLVESSQDDISIYKLLGKNLAGVIDSGESSGQLIVDLWPNDSALSLSLTAKSDFPLPSVLADNFERGEILVLEDEKEVSLHFNISNAQQVLMLSIPRSLVIRKKNNTDLMLTILFYCGIMISVLIWLYPLLRRLILLQKSALAFGEGQFDVRIESSKFSYITEIEHAFNSMAERIQSLISDNKLLSRAVSHDLKTPLSRLRFGIETLAETENESQRAKYHARITRDLNEMESLVNTLLQYARLDEASVQLSIQPLVLSGLVSQLLQEYENEDVVITFNLDYTDTKIQADKTYLKMLVNNIIGNAMQYCQKQVLVKLEMINDKLCLTIADDGAGIPEEERESVLKPFIRGASKSPNKGHGMGLAIVSKIAEWHGAEVSIGRSCELGGAEVDVLFPLS